MGLTVRMRQALGQLTVRGHLDLAGLLRYTTLMQLKHDLGVPRL